MSDLPAAELKCQKCGARLQQTQDWCSLCLSPKAAPGSVDRVALSTDQSTPTAGGSRHRRRRSQAAAPGRKRTRMVSGLVLAAVLVTGGAIALSGGSTPDQVKKPALQGPAGDGLGVQPGVGAPVNGPVPVRILH